MDSRAPLWHLDSRLLGAVVVSLAVHAAAMSLSFPAPRVLLTQALPVLEVSLRELVVPPAIAPEPPPPAPATAPQKRAKPYPRTHEPVRTARTSESPAPAPSGKVEEERAQASAAEPAVAPEMSSAQSPPLAVQLPVPRVPSSQLLSNYGLAIAQMLARYKEYPPIAQMQGWEGSVTMQLRVAASGRLLDAEVHRSSGHGVLDREALAMAAKAARFPPPPEELGGNEVRVLVPVVFRLER